MILSCAGKHPRSDALGSHQEPKANLALARIGPEKGIIHLALAAVNNAVWDMFAKSRKKPLWKLIVDMTPVCRLVFLTQIGS